MISLLLASLISFSVTMVSTYYFIFFAQRIGLVGVDVMKKDKPKIAEFGSPPIILGFIFGTFTYIGLTNALDIYFMAAITSLIIISFIGTLDELTHLWKKEGKDGFEKYKRIGLPQWLHPLVFMIGALPLMAVKAGYHVINLPFLGSINVGLLYPLVLIPLGITGAANATNMLAGFNGLQAGLGSVVLTFLGVYAYMHNEITAAVIAFIFVASLIAFLFYNWYPAKIFPGSLDYLVGAVIAIVAIVGNIEKFALLCFAPWFIELILKARSKFKAENFGVLQKDGTLKAPYKKVYSLTHVVMKLGKFKEWQVSLILIMVVFVWCLFCFILV